MKYRWWILALLGFVCERYAVKNTVDISQFGGWRNYLKQRNLS